MNKAKLLNSFKENMQSISNLTDRYFVYALWSLDEIVYVGKTSNLGKRLGQHVLNKTFDSFSYIELNSEYEMYSLEIYAIATLQPKYNKTQESKFISVKRARKKMIENYPELKNEEIFYTYSWVKVLEQYGIPITFKSRKAYLPIIMLPEAIDISLELYYNQKNKRVTV